VYAILQLPLAIVFLMTLVGALQAAPTKPFPQRLTYGGSTLVPNNYTRAQLDVHVRQYYAEWKRRYVVTAGVDGQGNRLYRIAFGKPGTANHQATVSEGQGWGMVILPIMAGYDRQAQQIFDGLLRYALQFPSENDARLMTWYVRNGAPQNGQTSAFDGDADIAYGLLLAHKQWGSGGAINYAQRARARLAGVLASTIGPTSRLPMLGDWVEPNGAQYNQWPTRPSDFMPPHFHTFHVFSKFAGWTSIVNKVRSSLDQLQTSYSPGRGLGPDFAEPISASNRNLKPARANFLEDQFDGAYSSNACRIPLRAGMDAVLNRNASSLVSVRRITNWASQVTGGDPQRFRAGYYLNGQPLPNSNYFTTMFVAPLGVAAMSSPNRQAWLNSIYEAVHDNFSDYYEDTITLLSLLVMSGNYWDPTK